MYSIASNSADPNQVRPDHYKMIDKEDRSHFHQTKSL